jgi:hypothetical protein
MILTSVFLTRIKDFREEYQGKLAEFENFSKVPSLRAARMGGMPPSRAARFLEDC